MGRSKRSEVFNPHEVCIVHAVQRCVRRTGLMGKDKATGRDYSHRREWVRRRLEALASTAACDVLASAILPNHVHVVLRNRPDVVKTWSDEEVAIRWLKLFPGRRIEEQLGCPSEADVKKLLNNEKKLEQVRERLSDISWFMRAFSEKIARTANREDDCTGRFWEGRFKAQRLLDDLGTLACTMYVDLNLIRASLAKTLEESEYSSVYDRLMSELGAEINSAAFDLSVLSTEEAGDFHKHKTIAEQRAELREQGRQLLRESGRMVPRDAWLAPMFLGRDVLSNDPQPHRDGLRASDRGFLQMDLPSYVNLLRWTAARPSRKQRAEALAKGAQAAASAAATEVAAAEATLAPELAQTLEALGVDGELWCDLVWNFKRYFGQSSCAGRGDKMQAHAKSLGKCWRRGQRQLPVEKTSLR